VTRYYVSKCHDTMNGVPYAPERVTPYLCLNPSYRVTLDGGCRVDYILDSGAFQDVRSEDRLSFGDALTRQLRFEAGVGRRAEAIVSYDRLVDEQVEDGVQFKERVSESLGREYVEETVEAAKYLVSQRGRLDGRGLVLSCQGATVPQYMDCLRAVLDVASPEDVVGLGGFCILSRSKKYEEEFYEVVRRGFPMIRENGNARVHVFGMGVFRALVQAEMFARTNGIQLSYDTSSAELNSVYGRCFDPVEGRMAAVFGKIHKKQGYVPAELATFNVRMITEFWANMGMLSDPPEDFAPSMV